MQLGLRCHDQQIRAEAFDGVVACVAGSDSPSGGGIRTSGAESCSA